MKLYIFEIYDILYDNDIFKFCKLNIYNNIQYKRSYIMFSDTFHYPNISKYNGLISEKIIQKAIGDIEINGYMTLESINEYIKNNTLKSSFEFNGIQIGVTEFIYIDMRINYNLFMIKNTFYTYDTLAKLHPFEQFNKIPEDILIQQVAVLMNSKYRTEFGMQDINAEPNSCYTITESIPMQIYIAGVVWDDFMNIVKFSNGFKQFVTPMLLTGGSSNVKFIADLFGISKNLSPVNAQIEDVRIAQIEEKIENTIKPLIIDNEEKAKKIKELEAKLAMLGL